VPAASASDANSPAGLASAIAFLTSSISDECFRMPPLHDPDAADSNESESGSNWLLTPGYGNAQVISTVSVHVPLHDVDPSIAYTRARRGARSSILLRVVSRNSGSPALSSIVGRAIPGRLRARTPWTPSWSSQAPLPFVVCAARRARPGAPGVEPASPPRRTPSESGWRGRNSASSRAVSTAFAARAARRLTQSLPLGRLNTAGAALHRPVCVIGVVSLCFRVFHRSSDLDRAAGSAGRSRSSAGSDSAPRPPLSWCRHPQVCRDFGNAR